MQERWDPGVASYANRPFVPRLQKSLNRIKTLSSVRRRGKFPPCKMIGHFGFKVASTEDTVAVLNNAQTRCLTCGSTVSELVRSATTGRGRHTHRTLPAIDFISPRNRLLVFLAARARARTLSETLPSTCKTLLAHVLGCILHPED